MRFLPLLALATATPLLAMPAASPPFVRTPATSAALLTLDDVLKTVSIEMVAPSPDGHELAAVIQRPVKDGEVAGRNSYEIDPSRNDVWLLSRDGSSRRRLTNGELNAAGFWCAQWSPDGQRLAMLSTDPRGTEPRGGDAVRLYIWDQKDDRLTRASDRAMMTQTRYGSPFNALDLQGAQTTEAKACRTRDENAPFIWLDDRRLLVVQMPQGQTSALFSQFGRPAVAANLASAAMRDGRSPTVEVSQSPQSDGTSLPYFAEVVVVDILSGSRSLVAKVPAYPFEGMLSLSVSPDGRELAILAPVRALPPHEVGPDPMNSTETGVQKRLGIANLTGRDAVRWIDLPFMARLPLDLLGWSPEGSAFAMRARRGADEKVARLFVVDASGSVEPAAPSLVTDALDAGTFPHKPSAVWEADGSLRTKASNLATPGSTASWWRVSPGKSPFGLPDPTAKLQTPELPVTADELAGDRVGIVWQDRTKKGLFLKETHTDGSPTRELLALNTHLSMIAWGEIRTIDYTMTTGRALKGLVILPPNYDPGQRYPLLVWVYPGTMITGERSYWSDPYMPGIYNLQLYAAQGYVVLAPSMPLDRSDAAGGPYNQMQGGVLPAIDKLVSLGIADSEKVGVFGQSYGGYATYALVTQTNRFSAAAAIAGITDFGWTLGTFDAGSQGWPGIAQDKSANRAIWRGSGFAKQPFEDADLFARNSPIANVSKVQTPLLLAHGSLDTRGHLGEAEAFFTALYRQGKTARLLRYQGESHSVSLSPANVRNLFCELIDWFDRYVKREESKCDLTQ